ncbi:MAG: FAD:protein FMN transferase [Verrucomicrobiales bacterium]|jgi:thiamine biosynthesis lipoprotein|nr:FAD:protein FMN transferase [Verrucomicrobiales bacterium]
MHEEIHKIGAHAMATEFQIYVTGTNEAKAMAVASAALRDLEPLESELSRFKRNSDISRLNHLHKGESTPIGVAALDCIQLAQDIHSATEGAFDITIGPLIAVLTNPDHSPRDPSSEELSKAIDAIGINKIKLNHDSLTATVLSDNLWLDLGGIGKGYALDQMALILKESGINNAMLDAGGSTLLAFGDGPDGKGWIGGLGEPDSPEIILNNNSLSGSGFSERGEHIIDPRKHCRVPMKKCNAWALAPYAALADALSTAFLVMAPEEIETLCVKHQEIEAILPSI